MKLMEITARIQRVLMVSLVILVGGCSGNLEPQRVERIQLQLQASSNINPNAYSAGNPVRVLIYQLRSFDAFMFSDYFSLVNKSGREITEQMNVFYDGILSPGEQRIVTVPVSQDVLALGIVTAFQDIQQAHWKNTYSVPDDAGRHSLFSNERDKKEKRVLVKIHHLTTTLESLDK